MKAFDEGGVKTRSKNSIRTNLTCYLHYEGKLDTVPTATLLKASVTLTISRSCVNPLPDNKILDCSKLKQIADYILKGIYALFLLSRAPNTF